MKLLRKTRQVHYHPYRFGVNGTSDRERVGLQVELSDEEWVRFEQLCHDLPASAQKKLYLAEFPDRNVLWLGYADKPLAHLRLANLREHFMLEKEAQG